jgi:phosphate transporter
VAGLLTHVPLPDSIYQLEKTVHASSGTDAESQPLMRSEDPETVFSRALDVELEKISSFYSVKERELVDEVQQVLRDVGTFEEGESGEDEDQRGEGVVNGAAPVRSSTAASGNMPRPFRPRSGSQLSTQDGIEDSDDEGDETTALTAARSRTGAVTRRTAVARANTDMTASTELTRSRRFSHTFTYEDFAEQGAMMSGSIMLKKRIVGLYVQLCELKSYVQLNRTGFRKVLKKFDKMVNRQLRSKYMETYVDPALPFRVEAMGLLEENIAKMVQAYMVVVTNGDEEAAKSSLRSHLREHVVWERNTVWRDMIGLERRAEAASLGHTLLGRGPEPNRTRRQGDDDRPPSTKEFVTPIGRFSLPAWLVSSTMFTLVVVIVVFLGMLFIPIMQKPEQQNCLALLIFVSLLWATEVSPHSNAFVVSLNRYYLKCSRACARL